MTKVKLTKLEKTLYILSAIFALAAIIMIVGTSIVPTETTGIKQKIDSGFYGYELVFGLKDGDLSGLKFSFLAFLPYLFTLAGFVLLVIRILDKFLTKKFDFLITGLFLVSSILFFISGNFAVFSANLVGKLFASFNYKISYGLIVSGICAFISAGLSLVSYMLSEFVPIENEITETQENEVSQENVTEKEDVSKTEKTSIKTED